MLGGNHSDVVEVLKFRSETSPTARNLDQRDEFDEGTESVEVDTAFEPNEEPKKTVSKW